MSGKADICVWFRAGGLEAALRRPVGVTDPMSLRVFKMTSMVVSLSVV